MSATRTASLLLAALAGWAACATGTCGRAAAAEAADVSDTADAGPVSYAVVIARGRITPARLEVPAGRKIRLALRNAGPGPSEFENLKLRVEKVLAPGASSVVVIHPLRPGSYAFVDEFHPDTAQLLLVAR